jgi:hypothetical protein
MLGMLREVIISETMGVGVSGFLPMLEWFGSAFGEWFGTGDFLEGYFMFVARAVNGELKF